MKNIRTAVLSVLLLLLFGLQTAVFAEEPSYVYTCDFEHLTTADMKSEKAIGFQHKSSEMSIETLDGSKVLRYHHKKLEKSEDCYTDFIATTEKYGLKSTYVMSYDFRYTGSLGCTWQICCSRQVPASGTQFQQAGLIGTDGVITFSKSDVTFTMEPDRWYNLAAVMNETNNIFDLYVDGVLIAEAVPYNIGDASATQPNLLRIGFNGGTEEGTAYIDNVKIYNSDVPYEVASPEITVIAPDKDEVAEFPLPQYTADASISGAVWYILGTAASLVLGAVGYILLRKLNVR
ncbi:MAG: hypothetical protein IJD06_08805 [Clostridia bacterium]|nr:hypothetical protein [Clostridia bacterium]